MQSNRCSLGHRRHILIGVRPDTRSTEPLTETDGDETRMAKHRDDDAGENSAVRANSQPPKPSDQEPTTHEACGHHPYREWCRAQDGVTNKRQREEQYSVPVASADHGFFTDGHEQTSRGDGEITRGATPFFVVNVKSSRA